MAEVFRNDPKKVMAEMMPSCMDRWKSKAMDPDMMRSMMKNTMGEQGVP